MDTIQLQRQDFSNLPAFEKNFYHEHPAVLERTPEATAEYRARREIHVEGTGVPKPVTTFDEASFPGKDHQAGPTLPPLLLQQGMCQN